MSISPKNNIGIGYRLIGSEDCHDCKTLMGIMDRLGMAYEFMDANADENQDFCDQHEVDQLPVLQAYNLVSKAIILSKTGVVNPMRFFKESVDVASKQYGFDNRYAVKFQPNGERRNPYKKKGCSNCGKQSSSKRESKSGD